MNILWTKKGNFKKHVTFSGGINRDCASKYKTIINHICWLNIQKVFAGEWQYACPIYRMPGAQRLK